MHGHWLGLLVLGAASGAAAADAGSPSTDFGVRTVSGALSAEVEPADQGAAPTYRSIATIAAAAGIGSRWGRVTSTYRSPDHNRRVGGARNSYHLRGRAIDIARRAGVSHWQIEAAYRAAGYRIVESLDEGDHSHFAFSFGGDYAPIRRAAAPATRTAEVTSWGMVHAPRSR